MSVSIPLEIANRLASGYFGRSCEYENESKVTYAKQLERFLDILRKQKTGELLLVEVVVLNSPLEGSLKIEINGGVRAVRAPPPCIDRKIKLPPI